MAQEVTNFARFYSLLKWMKFFNESQREEAKLSFVRQFTNGRTDSLREMTKTEYDIMCSILENTTGYTLEKSMAELRRWRSICLRLMQEIGVDTTDWKAVDNYCRSPKIAGRDFHRLHPFSLERLSLKLRMILKKQKNK